MMARYPNEHGGTPVSVSDATIYEVVNYWKTIKDAIRVVGEISGAEITREDIERALERMSV